MPTVDCAPLISRRGPIWFTPLPTFLRLRRDRPPPRVMNQRPQYDSRQHQVPTAPRQLIQIALFRQRVLHEIQEKTDVLPPPVPAHRVNRPETPPAPPLTILWCHRWENDKNPEPFFKALLQLDEAGCQFKLVLAGEEFRTAPPVFAQACKRLGSHIIHTGYIPRREDYLAMLSGCDVVVSTAIQENFGIAVVEAILSGCQPLLPNRLAYPELIPPELHGICLYQSDGSLLEPLRDVLEGRRILTPSARTELQASVEARFGAQAAVLRLDEALVAIVDRLRG